MDHNRTLVLFLFEVWLCSAQYQRYYHYVNMKKSWTDAQRYCREEYTDLATFDSMDDINRLKPTFSYEWVWIGLRDDPKSWKKVMTNDPNSWRWSATGGMSQNGYQRWQLQEPNNSAGREHCVLMQDNGEWNDGNCAAQLSFVCFTATKQNEKSYVFVSDPKTWSSAQAYCREHHTDLATIESESENSEVSSVITGGIGVWIGLYRVPWTWSDNSPSPFRLWQKGRPENSHGVQFCVGEDSRHEWNDLPCETGHPFLCHQVSELKTTVRMKIETRSDLTDPDNGRQILQQLTAALTVRGWTDFTLRWTNLEKRSQHGRHVSDCESGKE